MMTISLNLLDMSDDDGNIQIFVNLYAAVSVFFRWTSNAQNTDIFHSCYHVIRTTKGSNRQQRADNLCCRTPPPTPFHWRQCCDVGGNNRTGVGCLRQDLFRTADTFCMPWVLIPTLLCVPVFFVLAAPSSALAWDVMVAQVIPFTRPRLPECSVTRPTPGMRKKKKNVQCITYMHSCLILLFSMPGVCVCFVLNSFYGQHLFAVTDLDSISYFKSRKMIPFFTCV